MVKNTRDISSSADQSKQIYKDETPIIDVARMVRESSDTRAVIGYTADGVPLALEMRGGVLVGVVGEENEEEPSDKNDREASAAAITSPTAGEEGGTDGSF